MLHGPSLRRIVKRQGGGAVQHVAREGFSNREDLPGLDLARRVEYPQHFVPVAIDRADDAKVQPEMLTPQAQQFAQLVIGIAGAGGELKDRRHALLPQNTVGHVADGPHEADMFVAAIGQRNADRGAVKHHPVRGLIPHDIFTAVRRSRRVEPALSLLVEILGICVEDRGGLADDLLLGIAEKFKKGGVYLLDDALLIGHRDCIGQPVEHFAGIV